MKMFLLFLSCGVVAYADINATLMTVREKYKLPALAGAIVTDQGMAAIGAAGAPTNALWHLGSNTKAMTATLIGLLVEQGKLKWETPVGEVFPDALEPLQNMTLLHLLSHRGGLPANDKWTNSKRPIREQRRQVALRARPEIPPGEKYVYSNLGYVIAGAMAEQVMDASWEELMRTRLFAPLGMKSVGFGSHDGKPDNPPVLGPAGRIHCTLEDWARFVADWLRGLCGKPSLLPTNFYQNAMTPPFSGNYALGWIVCERKWGGGKVLTHNGSNTLNYSLAWVAPKRKFAVLVCANRGDAETAKACDEAAAALIRVAETFCSGNGRFSE